MSTPCTHVIVNTKQPSRRRLSVSLAHSEEDILECQKLRYHVFAEEMGVKLKSAKPGLDQDRFDPHCKHLIVRDHITGKVVGTTRLLTDEDAVNSGMFYSETEFKLAPILNMNGRFMEVGRTCIHPENRGGATLAMLWQGLAQIVMLNKIDYLIGCASIPLCHGDSYIQSILAYLHRHHMSPPNLRATPLIPLPRRDAVCSEEVILPTLLKGYLRQGAIICGEPYWDAAFNVADVFVLLDRDRLSRRYARHFMTGT